jgi:hypothetical protein
MVAVLGAVMVPTVGAVVRGADTVPTVGGVVPGAVGAIPDMAGPS